MALESTRWDDLVLGFWYGELGAETWFTKSEATDQRVREGGLAVYERLARTFPPEVWTEPRAALAAVIVLDQFPRNMFRNTPQAFATDARALELAKAAVGRGLDRVLAKQERLFVYLPFEHSETLADQQRSVELIADLGDPELLRYAIAHKEIIERFGRFPHRNAVLGRVSTDAEIGFLQEPGSSF